MRKRTAKELEEVLWLSMWDSWYGAFAFALILSEDERRERKRRTADRKRKRQCLQEKIREVKRVRQAVLNRRAGERVRWFAYFQNEGLSTEEAIKRARELACNAFPFPTKLPLEDVLESVAESSP
jgi:hypothetical protein